MATTTKLAELKPIMPVGNGASTDIATTAPYTVRVTIEGSSAILFHRWDNEAVASKATAAKNSTAKKRDNIESYVYRTDKGHLAIPGEALRMAIVNAARYRQDPRSPRKSAMDLYKAGVIALTEYADLGVTDWDYVDRRRVTIQRAGITRERPALRQGWHATFDLMVQTAEYISSTDLLTILGEAGRLIGVGDFRPTYGRFAVVGYEVL
jgi:hypothetical protein